MKSDIGNHKIGYRKSNNRKAQVNKHSMSRYSSLDIGCSFWLILSSFIQIPERKICLVCGWRLGMIPIRCVQAIRYMPNCMVVVNMNERRINETAYSKLEISDIRLHDIRFSIGLKIEKFCSLLFLIISCRNQVCN